MKLPSFCYQKAFWLLVPIIIISNSSGIAAVMGQIGSLDTRLNDIEHQVDSNNVPELKETISKRFDRIDENLFIIQKQNLENYKEICKLAEGDC